MLNSNEVVGNSQPSSEFFLKEVVSTLRSIRLFGRIERFLTGEDRDSREAKSQFRLLSESNKKGQVVVGRRYGADEKISLLDFCEKKSFIRLDVVESPQDEAIIHPWNQTRGQYLHILFQMTSQGPRAYRAVQYRNFFDYDDGFTFEITSDDFVVMELDIKEFCDDTIAVEDIARLIVHNAKSTFAETLKFGSPIVVGKKQEESFEKGWIYGRDSI